jgi:SAM-dependent methyltransferase
MKTMLDSVQMAQEEEYAFPYHYIPALEDNRFSQVVHWPWGYRYLGGMQIVFEQLEKMPFKSLIDLGCGDGRFLREVGKRYPGAEVIGVDYSERCIQMARAMNPDTTFLCRDVTDTALEATFDVATAVEVLEHIRPEQLDKFLKATAGLLKDKGSFILTVPHKNKPIQPKHFQHFTGDGLVQVLSSYFESFATIPFDPYSPLLKRFQKLLGGFGKHFIVTNGSVLSFFFRLYTTRYLHTPHESRCGRIAVTCKKK